MIKWIGFEITGLLFTLIVCLTLPLSAAELLVKRIGIVFDGPWERNDEIRSLFQKEILDLMQGDYDVRFPRDKLIVADWTVGRVKAALDRLLADPEVDLVIASGVLASNVYTFPINDGAESGAAFVDGEDTIIGAALGRNLALGQLSDVEVDGVEDLQVLGFQLSTGTWIPITNTANKGITSLDYLYDANQTATPASGDVAPNNATP